MSSTRRTRVTGVAAVVVGSAVLAAWVLGVRPPPASGPAALPDRVHDVPAHVEARDDEGSWAREPDSDLAVGRGAVALTTDAGLPVVVDAEDGRYHRLDLPGFAGNDKRLAQLGPGPALALSPDGRSLAYAGVELAPDPGATPTPTFLGIVDLGSGAVRRAELPDGIDGQGVLLDRLVWSVSSRWLAWHGTAVRTWTTPAYDDVLYPQGPEVSGRLAPGSTVVEAIDRRATGQAGFSVNLAVDDARVVVAAHGDEVLRWDGRVLGTVRTSDRQRVGGFVLRDDGRTMAG